MNQLPISLYVYAFRHPCFYLTLQAGKESLAIVNYCCACSWCPHSSYKPLGTYGPEHLDWCDCLFNHP